MTKIKFIFDDKVLHVLMGMFIVLIVGRLAYWQLKDILLSVLVGILLGIILGAAKELIYDGIMNKGTKSTLDFLSTLYGSIVGFIILLVWLVIIHFN